MIKIPTVVGIALLLIAIFLGVFIYKQNQIKAKQGIIQVTPLDIQTVNITDNQATIIWQTKTPATGLVSFGTNQFLGDSQNDDRDQNNLEPRLTHFVTLKNLSANTTYFFKVRSGAYFYPDSPLSFKTPQPISVTQESSTSAHLNSPIFGVLLDSNLTPIQDAIIELKVPNGSELATLTTTAGNFILPLVNLRKADLTDNFILDQRTQAVLIAKREDLTSNVKITLPTTDTPLPKIILGQDSDFSFLNTATGSAQRANPLDLNDDSKVNALDTAIVLDNVNRNPTDPLYNPDADR